MKIERKAFFLTTDTRGNLCGLPPVTLSCEENDVGAVFVEIEKEQKRLSEEHGKKVALHVFTTMNNVVVFINDGFDLRCDPGLEG